MKRFLVASLLTLAAAVLTSETASAQSVPGPYGFLPYGFYQPYGAQYGSSIRTPPYFATNPPVYYGARHSRPYGLSPFASPPLVVPSSNYRSRLRTQFLQPRVPTPKPVNNRFISHSKVVAPTEVAKLGAVQINPFVEPVDKIAKK